MKHALEEIIEGIYLIGGPNQTAPEDAAVYLIDFGGELVMIDAGAGTSASQIARNIELLGLNPSALSTLVLTHCHIDHIGAAPYFRKHYRTKILIHEADARAIATGDSRKTAADWYGTTFPPTKADETFTKEEEFLIFGNETLHVLHTPGHTPGSVSVYLDRQGKRILFGQDIHGPFNQAFDSNLDDWKKSMNKLLTLNADILCEGHFGIYRPGSSVRRYIERYLEEYD